MKRKTILVLILVVIVILALTSVAVFQLLISNSNPKTSLSVTVENQQEGTGTVELTLAIYNPSNSALYNSTLSIRYAASNGTFKSITLPLGTVNSNQTEIVYPTLQNVYYNIDQVINGITYTASGFTKP